MVLAALLTCFTGLFYRTWRIKLFQLNSQGLPDQYRTGVKTTKTTAKYSSFSSISPQLPEQHLGAPLFKYTATLQLKLNAHSLCSHNQKHNIQFIIAFIIRTSHPTKGVSLFLWVTTGYRLKYELFRKIKHIYLVFYGCNRPHIILHTFINVFSAGEEWTENPETYESSFYKRTLDNEIYIFTAPSFNGKFSERFGFACTFLCVRIFSVVWHWAFSVLCLWTPSQPYWQRSGSQPSDITLFILLLFPLCLKVLIPTFPPFCPVYFLSSPLITLTDISAVMKPCLKLQYTWLD